jgi:hypothetical protein
LGPFRLQNKEQQIICGQKNTLRNHSDTPKTLKNKMVSGSPLPYSIIVLDLQEVWSEVMDWIDLAQDRERGRALVNAVMNHRVP